MPLLTDQIEPFISPATAIYSIFGADLKNDHFISMELNFSGLKSALKLKKLSFLFITTLFLTPLIFTNCKPNKSEVIWHNELPVIGSQSSPRTADLNQDGVLDIVIGAGKNENQKSNQGIIAMDGLTGSLLWQQESSDQVYGSATFYDITDDGVPEVFIGGRSPYFMALDGKTGKIIWQYEYKYENDSILKHARFNFNNSVFVPDQNNDGHPELITTNGGNSKANPNSEIGRYPGVMILFDIKTGSILAADTMPDGKETYMSPVSYSQPDGKDHMIVFGTGGETISGNLYVAKVSDLLERKLSNAKLIATEEKHGFVAPPSLADISEDGYLDIIAISHASTVFAIDGKDYHQRWKQKISNTESSNSFAVGFFTDDEVPDFFTFVSKGEWPNNTGSLQVLLDGTSGSIAYMDSIGCTGFSSPVVYDIDADGTDEAIISINEFDCSKGFTDNAIKNIENKLLAINFKKQSTQIIDQAKGLKNIFSTPWIGDLDDDGYLDIINCQYYSYGGLLTFLGMSVKRIETPISIKEDVRWGAYMGSRGDGIFLKKQ
jgi:outer membrane protein assembly factor BamB